MSEGGKDDCEELSKPLVRLAQNYALEKIRQDLENNNKSDATGIFTLPTTPRKHDRTESHAWGISDGPRRQIVESFHQNSRS